MISSPIPFIHLPPHLTHLLSGKNSSCSRRSGGSQADSSSPMLLPEEPTRHKVAACHLLWPRCCWAHTNAFWTRSQRQRARELLPRDTRSLLLRRMIRCRHSRFDTPSGDELSLATPAHGQEAVRRECALHYKQKEVIVLMSPLHNTGLWNTFWGSRPARTGHHSQPQPPTAAAGGHQPFLLQEFMGPQGLGHMPCLSFGGRMREKPI